MPTPEQRAVVVRKDLDNVVHPIVTPVSNEPAFPVDLDLVDADTTRRIMRA